jgi:hypothetical protein
MTLLDSSALAWAILAAQSLGILSACLARFSQGCSCQRVFQAFFLLCLVMVAGAGVASFALEPECWLTSGALLAVMLVAATFPLGQAREATAW